jgi:hypothetical protein
MRKDAAVGVNGVTATLQAIRLSRLIVRAPSRPGFQVLAQSLLSPIGSISIVLTANTGFTQWKNLFPSETQAVATVDRLIDRATIRTTK